MTKAFNNLTNFMWVLLRSFRKHQGGQLAGNLTFTSLFAIVPVLTLIVLIVALMPDTVRIGDTLWEYLLINLSPPAAGKVITLYVTQFVEHAGRLTLIGSGLFLISAWVLMRTIDRTLEQVFGMELAIKAPRSIWRTVWIYSLFLIIGPIALSLVLTATTYLMHFTTNLSAAQWLLHAMISVVPMVATAFTLSFLYCVVPQSSVYWVHALLGGMIGAVLMEIARMGFGWYLRTFPTLEVIYGALSAMPIALIWLYFCWVIFIFGAEITALAPIWGRRANSFNTVTYIKGIF